jgi:cyanate permease
MKKILIILAVLVFAGFCAYVLFPLAMFIVKVLIGLGIALVFATGVWVGRFFPRKSN